MYNILNKTIVYPFLCLNTNKYDLFCCNDASIFIALLAKRCSAHRYSNMRKVVHLLRPLTKQFKDNSTDATFNFIFFCDVCGKEWYSYSLPFSLSKSPFDLNRCDQYAKLLLWQSEHDAAYGRANNGAISHFNRCPVCSRWVCDDCFTAMEIMCYKCIQTKLRKGEK